LERAKKGVRLKKSKMKENGRKLKEPFIGLRTHLIKSLFQSFDLVFERRNITVETVKIPGM